MNIASYIDHTNLSPQAIETDIKKLCREAVSHQFAAVCVPPYYAALAVQELKETEVKTATVIGFPFGYTDTGTKMTEMINAINAGVDELDVVHNQAAFKSGDWNFLKEEISILCTLKNQHRKILKLIVESGLLSDEELINCCRLYAETGIDFMKTSTGFASTGATVNAVHIMRAHLPGHIQIKASGGIRTFAFAQELIDAGATRLGCSAGMSILEEAKNRQQ